MNASRYVTAFPGRRDAYQVPMALAQAGQLEQFITTFYLKDQYTGLLKMAPMRLPESIRLRRATAFIPDERVQSLIHLELVEQLGRKLGISPPKYWEVINREMSHRAAKRAKQSGADLLLYEPYASRAFQSHYPDRNPRKVLFHFHPHPDLEAGVYAQDARLHPSAIRWESNDGGGQSSKRAGLYDPRNAWDHADLILCASSFTKRSVCEVGADESLCRVVPYGHDCPEVPPDFTASPTFRGLFVGTGIRRKGLHHLLAAWKNARLPAGSELVLVCRNIDPELKKRASEIASCRLIPGLGREALAEMFRSSTLFIMPSLVEGFGQVYLESLAAGCPVLGTANTCLPDLGNEADGLFLTDPFDPELLRHRIETLADALTGNREIRQRCFDRARLFSWQRFRSGIIGALRQ